MIERIAINLVAQMTEERLIHKDMEERYVYVAVSWIEKFITVISIVVISIVVKQLLPTLFFLLFFLGLRKRTGGYHLNKFYQCYLSTIASYLAVLMISVNAESYFKLMLAIWLLATCTIVIIGTVNHPNIHMDSEELTESKKAARMIVLLEGSIILFCVLLGADITFISYMSMAVILCALLLCVAKILKQEVKGNEED